MNIPELMCFLAVAREKSISKAAQSLYMTQPSLSTKIRQLERSIGAPLFYRNWDGVQLTKQGNSFQFTAIQLVREWQETSTVLSHFLRDGSAAVVEEAISSTDLLVIGIDNWLAPYCLTPILEELNHFPDLKYEFITRDAPVLHDLVENDIISLGIYYSDEALPDRFAYQLLHDETVLLYNANNGIVIHDSSDLQPLLDLPFLLLRNPTMYMHKHWTATITQQLGIENIHIVDNLNVAVSLIRSGKAYTILPKLSVAPLLDKASGSIHMVGLDSILSPLPIVIVNDKSERFVDEIQYLTKKLTQLLSNHSLTAKAEPR